MNEKPPEIKTVNTTIEILGKFYPIRCPETELPSLQEAALRLNKEMLAVRDSGKGINVDRIAIITALNLAHQLLSTEQKNNTLMSKINQRIVHLQDKLDTAIHKTQQTELIYSSEE